MDNLTADNFVRKLNRPYFELRTPDGAQARYLEGSQESMLRAESEKLREFLPPVQIQAQLGDRLNRTEVKYLVERYPNLRRLDSLPKSEFDLFEAAVNEFYQKAAPPTHSYEISLRKNFKLPDPTLEPDAYWVYGEDFERRLLILWGCEQAAGTSLLLGRHEVFVRQNDGRTVVDELRKRIIGWKEQQKDALALVAKTREPLSRYLGSPLRDEKGKLRGIQVGEEILPVEKARKLRFLLPPENNRFRKACEEFYKRAETATSPYEKEIRQSFQLPDLAKDFKAEKARERFWVHGPWYAPRLIVLCDDRLEKENAIWLTPCAELKIPPPSKNPELQAIFDSVKAPAATLTEQLQRSTVPAWQFWGAIGALPGVPLILALVLWLVFDKTPPQPIHYLSTTDDNRSIVVQFHKELRELPNDPAQVFYIKDEAGQRVEIKSAHRGGVGKWKNREVLLIAGPDFVDSRLYSLTLDKLSDKFGNHYKAQTEFKPFQYIDRVPPRIVMACSDGGNFSTLIVRFSKAMEATAISVASNYQINGVIESVTRVGSGGERNTLAITMRKPLVPGSSNTLSIFNLQDTAVQPHPVTNSPFPFLFVDKIPPRLAFGGATNRPNEIYLHWNEPLDVGAATNVVNYSLFAGETRLTIGQARFADTRGIDTKSIVLGSTPMEKGKEYRLEITGVKDIAGNIASTNIVFQFDGGLDQYGPRIASVNITSDRHLLAVIFNRDNPIRPDSYAVINPLAYRLEAEVEGSRQRVDASVLKVQRVNLTGEYPDGVFSVILELNRELVAGFNKKLFLTVSNLADIWGRTNTVSNRQQVKLSGTSVKINSNGSHALAKDRKSVLVTFNVAIDKVSLNPMNFKLASGVAASAVDYEGAENHKALVIKFPSSVPSGYSGVCERIVNEQTGEADRVGFDEDPLPH